MADDTFIVQPRLRVTIEQQAAPIQQPSLSTPDAKPRLSPPTHVATRPTIDRFDVPPRAPSLSSAAKVGSANTLQWYTRGTAPRESTLDEAFVSSTSNLRIDQELSLEFDPLPSSPRQGPREPAFKTGEFASLDFPATDQKQTTAPENTALVKETAVDVERQERAVLASLVSSRIIGDAPAHAQDVALDSVDPAPGWNAVGERLSRHIHNCEALLRRNAFFSAREEAESAAVYLVRILDLMSNNYGSEPLLLAAQQALNESEDFTFSQRLTTDQNFLERLIASHQTQLLKNSDVSQLSPLVAAQHYRQHAIECLVQASQGHPWGSEVYYTLGRTLQAQADGSPANSDALRWRAVTYYQAATAVAPSNSIATNQLGYILLQMDRPQDARASLVASVEAKLSESALENLVEASRRLNDGATQHWAMQHLASMRHSQPPQSPVPQVVEVDPQTFMAISPRSIGPQPPLYHDTAARTATAPHAAPQR